MQRGLGRINPRKNTLRHIVIKLINIIDKEKVLKATKEEYQIIHRGTATVHKDSQRDNSHLTHERRLPPPPTPPPAQR